MKTFEFILKNHISYFSIIFQFFGICNDLPNTKKFLIHLIFFGSIFNLLILMGTIFIIIPYEEHIFYPSDLIGKFTDIIQLAFPILAHFVAILETMAARKHQMKIWTRIVRGNLILKDLKSYVTRKEEKTYIKKFIFFNLVSFLAEFAVISIATISNDYRWRNHWFTRLFSNIVGRLLNLHYILYVDLIYSRIRIINDELKDIILHGDNKQIFRKIQKIKMFHSNCWCISQSVNSRFGLSLLASITNYFICLTVDFYWMFIRFGDSGRLCKYSFRFIEKII